MGCVHGLEGRWAAFMVGKGGVECEGKGGVKGGLVVPNPHPTPRINDYTLNKTRSRSSTLSPINYLTLSLIL